MSASMTRTKTSEGGHSGPPVELPERWQIETLGKIAAGFVSGGTPPTKNNEFWKGNIPWITSKWLNLKLHLESGEKFISEDALKQSATTVVPRNNLIFATRVGVGKVAVNNIDLAINQDLAGVLVDSDRHDIRFLAYQLRSDRIQRTVASHKRGATIQGITRDALKELEIYLPPLAEQRKIAAVLGLVQRAIEQQERLIALTTELKKALLHKLFTEGLRGEPQKQSEIGLVPESWEVVTIGDLFKFSSGKSRPDDTELTASESRPFPVFGGNGVLGYSSRYLFEEPLLLIGRVGEYCGCAHHTAGRVWVSDNALYAKEILRETNTRYAAEYFSYANLNQYRNQAGQPLITQGVISKVIMPLPPIGQQREILEPLTLLNQKLSVSNRKHAALTALFRTLLHQLMTALIRVDKLDIEELIVGIS